MNIIYTCLSLYGHICVILPWNFFQCFESNLRLLMCVGLDTVQSLLLAQVHHSVTNPGVDKHMPAKLVHLLPCLSRFMLMEASLGAVPYQLHTPWSC